MCGLRSDGVDNVGRMETVVFTVGRPGGGHQDADRLSSMKACPEGVDGPMYAYKWAEE